MNSVICGGCGQRVEPTKILACSPKTKKQYWIVRCPRWRCGFNLDIEDYVPSPKRPERKDDGGRSFWTNIS